MTRRPTTIDFWRGQLPHWEVVDGRYFITMHLAGAIPQAGQDRVHALSAEYAQLSQQDVATRLQLERRIYVEMELWLDQAEHVVHLQVPDVAAMIVAAIEFRNGREWNVLEFVVMPSHLHLFLELGADARLKYSLEQFKRWTGHQAAKLLDLNGERFWQDEWFDHWSRSDEEDDKIVNYIRRNPVKARLVGDYQDWPFGSWNNARQSNVCAAASPARLAGPTFGTSL